MALALLPTGMAYFGAALITYTGFYYDISVRDGIGFFSLAQGIGVGYLSSAVFDVAVTVLHAEILTIGFALPAVLVVAATVWRRPRLTGVVAGALIVLATANAGANLVALFSDLSVCPPSGDHESACYRGAGATPFVLYAPAYALAARLLPARRHDGEQQAGASASTV
ncbi:hypothetical protein [Herbidospora cretacea]|uniref:hypothetical protein n=1 Tax=Herbidospora cretacea TaxID=28444 RepID=UPI0012FB3054|nr:hypothetical protein [Herbidospora cretacea]